MSDQSVSRRDFLRAGAAAGIAAATIPSLASAEDKEKKDEKEKKDKKDAILPTRKLGKSDIPVTILNQGGCFGDDRYLNLMYKEGIRYIDVADCYGKGSVEKAAGAWMNKQGNRKEIFLVTKDHPHSPDQWIEMLDKRLENIGTDYVDLFFIHALDKHGEFDNDAALEIPKSKEWAQAVEKMKKSGKIKLAGFSTHAQKPIRDQQLKNAADGWVDAVMMTVNPADLVNDKQYNETLDYCHKKGVGLISMKECKNAGKIKEVFPTFEKKGLNAHTATLSVVWNDERIASICSAMDNVKKLKENCEAARKFKPLTKDELKEAVAMLDAGEKIWCASCDGSCQRAAGTKADLNTIARYVSYVEENGQLDYARSLFYKLPLELRDWSGADLHAATEACHSKVDYMKIMEKAAKYFA